MNYAIALTVVVNTVLVSSELCPTICGQQRSRPKYKLLYWTYSEYVTASYREDLGYIASV